MATIEAVSDYFLANCDPDEGLSNLKLQKLCAYAHAFSLALCDVPLFDAPLHAWPHGPVIPQLYHQYRAYGKMPISSDVRPSESRLPFTDEELYVLETVNNYYGRYAAWTLRDMAHNDFPGDFDNPNRPLIPNDRIKANFLENKVVKTILNELA